MNSLTETRNSFACFSGQFKPCTEQQGYHKCLSIKGRLLSLGHLIATPLSIPAALIVRIVSVAAAALVFLVSVVGLLEFKEGKVDQLKNAGLSFVDHTVNLITSPITLVVERIRFLAGLIHPRAVYYRSEFYEAMHAVTV